MGYISKGIALCGKERLWDAIASFDLASIFLDSEQMTAEMLLLVKVLRHTCDSVSGFDGIYDFMQAIALFDAGDRDGALRRVQDLATACRHADTLPCIVVQVSFISDLINFIIRKHASHIYVYSVE